MLITIELPDRTVAALLERAQAEGRSATDLVVEVLVKRFGGGRDEAEFPTDDETAAKKG